MFMGHKNIQTFGPENKYWVPEHSRWNRVAYYARPNPHLVKRNDLKVPLNLNHLDHVEGVSGV
jgi:hypothetical protein